MSAFMCGRSHVATIAQYAADKKMIPRDFSGPAMFGNILLFENARSMDARYGDRWHDDGDYPAPQFEDDAEVLQWARPEYMTPAGVFRAIGCLAYQSCETSDWDSTAACKVLDAICKTIAEQFVPDAPNVPWGIDDKRSNVISLSSLCKRARA